MPLSISPESIGLPIAHTSRSWSPESAAEWEALLASEGMPAEPVRRSTVSLDMIGAGAIGTADLLSSLVITDRTVHRGRWVVDADDHRVWDQPADRLACSVSTEELPVGWLMSATDGAPSHGDGAASTTSGVSSASKRTRRTASTHGVGGVVDLGRWLRGRELPIVRAERARPATPDRGRAIVRGTIGATTEVTVAEPRLVSTTTTTDVWTPDVRRSEPRTLADRSESEWFIAEWGAVADWESHDDSHVFRLWSGGTVRTTTTTTTVVAYPVVTATTTVVDGVAGRYVLVDGRWCWESLTERAERLRLARLAGRARKTSAQKSDRERTRVASVVRDLPRVGSMRPKQIDGLRRRWLALSPTGRRLVCEALDLPTVCVGIDSLPEGAQTRPPVQLA